MHYWVCSTATQIFQTFWHAQFWHKQIRSTKRSQKPQSLCVYSKEEKYADVGSIKETRKEPNILVYLFIKVTKLNLLATTCLQPTANQVILWIFICICCIFYTSPIWNWADSILFCVLRSWLGVIIHESVSICFPPAFIDCNARRRSLEREMENVRITCS